jgi:hypothetical protein
MSRWAINRDCSEAGLVVAGCSSHFGHAEGFVRPVQTEAAAIKTGKPPMMRKSISPTAQHVLAIALAGALVAAVGGVVLLAIHVQGVFV